MCSAFVAAAAAAEAFALIVAAAGRCGQAAQG